jgi:uncharacterized membrane protein
MAERGDEPTIRRIFHISLLIKAGLSVVELVGGWALYAVSDVAVLRLVRRLPRVEMLENPHNVVTAYLHRSAELLAVGHRTAAGVYLMLHGAVKLFLVIMVLRGKSWAYPTFMAALTLLIAYQTYQLTLGFNAWLAGLTVFDLIILWMTWHEYQAQKPPLPGEAK